MQSGFASRFRKWIRVLATGRLLLFQVGSRYLKAISYGQENRELHEEEIDMALGDGTNWSGGATASILVGITVDFAPASEVMFQVRKGDGFLDSAIALTVAWNSRYPGEATMLPPAATSVTVRFARGGRQVEEIYLREASSPKLQPLILGGGGTTVNGLTVTHVST